MASSNFPVAVIGTAVKLPGAENCESFWKLLEDRGDTVSTFPDERKADIQHVLDSFRGHFEDEGKPFFTGSFFKNVDKFDAGFFHINPTEALVIEPEQRIFLETAWELLEDAGYASKIKGSKTGVYVGNTVNKYKYILTENHPSISHGNHSPFIASRVSYTLNLCGPAMMVATGCSSSMLAVHLACQGLLSGDCDMALAGGITLDLLPISLKTDIWNQLGITAPNVKCRAFDADAKGISKAEGCGIVLLKPLAKAIADNDNIYGVLEASTANQDGHSQGITAPHPGAQTNMLLQAWKKAEINPKDLGYIEAHGTGTVLGDPIEIMGITKAFEKIYGRETTHQLEKIPIGSVKANIGHLADGAAGVVSLIKVLLCFKHEKIPPAVNFSSPNPHINWKNAPVLVNTESREWNAPRDGNPRYSSVSAFGLLGTNVHVVVRDFSPKEEKGQREAIHPEVLCLAACSDKALLEFSSRLIDYFIRHLQMDFNFLRNVCYTLNTGREHRKFPYRAVAIADNITNMTETLRKIILKFKNESSVKTVVVKSTDPKHKTTRSTLRHDQQLVVDHFLQSKNIDWDQYYMKHTYEGKRKIGHLPTYPFQQCRYWPTVKSANLNEMYLHLEHKIQLHEKKEDDNGESLKPEQTPASQEEENSSISKMLLFDSLKDSFNKALGGRYDWVEKGDDNVFSLGVDSLVCTHIAMQFSKSVLQNSKVIFTQVDLHAHPTFNSLLHYLENKIVGIQKEKMHERVGREIVQAEKGPFRISFSQRRLWVIEKMGTSKSAYNATNCFKVTGNFHPDAFRRAVNTVISRHDAFHATIVENESTPRLVYDWEVDTEIKEIDMTKVKGKAEETALQKYQVDYDTEFDLATGPLVRTKLYRTANNVWIFTMVVHHIIFDGWSHFLFYNELWDTYKRYLQGEVVEKSKHLPLSCVFSHREEQEAHSVDSKLQEDLKYWLLKLAEPLPTTTFPGDKRRPEVFSYEGGRITKFIDINIFKKLNQSVPGSHTMFHSLLGAVTVLLMHFNPGENDMILGIPVTGRSCSEMMNVIGCFINTLTIRCSVYEGMTFRQILEHIKMTCVEAMDHQEAPFDLLVNKLKLQRSTSFSPVFSVNVCYHNEEIRDRHVEPPDDLNIERKLLHNNTSKWDVQFDFLEEDGCMRFTLEYYKGVFSYKYAVHLVDMFEYVVNALTNGCNSTIAELMYKPDMQEKAVLRGPSTNIWHQTIGQLILESLQRYPVSNITVFNGQTHCYNDLLNDALRIKSLFERDCFLKKGDHVGLLFENSYEGMCVIIACLITGLVYIPLNSEDPTARLEMLVHESSIRLLCFSKRNIAIANHLLWSCQQVDTVFCIDAVHASDIIETIETPLMDTELWNCVAEEAIDDIEGGGWKSSYTGEYMTADEMGDYKNNIYQKLKHFLHPTSTVLEIGCASGLTTQIISPEVNTYVATDLSEKMVVRLKQKALANVEVYCVSAIDIARLPLGYKYDVIILNSVVHCFPGHNYLRKVLTSCEGMLKEDGVLFIGDVMDIHKKEQLIASLVDYKNAHPDKRTKIDWNTELFLPKEFFYHFKETSSFSSVLITEKYSRVENELSKYRYDVMMSKKDVESAIQSCQSRKKYFSIDNLATGVNVEQLNIDPQDDAYILYTSGTTGRPKGVRIRQISLLNYCVWASEAYQLDVSSTIPLFSPLTFDFTVTSIIPPLLCGSTIEIHKPFTDCYEDIMNSNTINVGKFSPLHLETILFEATHPLNISTFIIGGEELTFALIEKLKKNKKEQHFCIWNEYGPTEATVGCVVRCIRSDEISCFKNRDIPIGKPINNVTVAVIHENSPVGIGAKGCLAIGGVCLTSGFIGGQELSRDIFKLACWHEESEGELMYITSDVVSLLPGKSDLVYFGRNSADITKINGMRVDILEIQHSMEKIPSIESAWVSTLTVESKTSIGAAVKTGQQVDTHDSEWKHTIIKTLSTSLPIYCIPKVIVSVSKPPINSNGKKDIHYLQSLFASELSNSGTLPSDGITAQEESLRKLWKSVLPIDRLPNIDEDFFFDLSGDSLQAIHLVRKMRSCGYIVSVNDIFRNTSIEKLSAQVQKARSCELNVDTVASRPFRPVPIVERYILGKGSSDRYALPALIKFDKRIDVSITQRGLQSVMAKHRSLSSRFFIENRIVFQEYVPLDNTKPKVDMVKVIQKGKMITHENIFLDKCKELEYSLNIDSGELLNAAIFDVNHKGVKEYFCLLVAHHIITDVVSWQQILEDFCFVLRQIYSGSDPQMSPCFTSYDTFCERLWEEGKSCSEDEVKFWREQETTNNWLMKKEMLSEPSIYRNAKWMKRNVNAASVRSISLDNKCSDEAVILTAFTRALSIQYNKEIISVCLESHGRHLRNHDATDTVGWCTSMFPIHVKTDTTQPFATACKKMKDSLLSIPQNGLKYGLLERLGKIQTRLPDTLFVFQGSLDAASKEYFSAGGNSFSYIPWIEIMMRELENGRFHRDENDCLDFPFQFFSWYFNDKLNFGCLFDQTLVKRKEVEELLSKMEFQLEDNCRSSVNPNLQLSFNDSNRDTSVPKTPLLPKHFKEISVEIISNIIVTPECIKEIERVLMHDHIVTKDIAMSGMHDFYQRLTQTQPSLPDVVVLIVRNKCLQSLEIFTQAFEAFLAKQLQKPRRFVISLENLPNSEPFPISEFPNVDLTIPNISSSLYNAYSDSEYDLPLTQEGYRHLAITTARVILKNVRINVRKVICVDGDYTLWSGECANNDILVSDGYKEFQSFLLEKKNKGFLLVLMSKNRIDDVEIAFRNEEMLLQLGDFVHVSVNWHNKSRNIDNIRKRLNIALQTFVFIDDSEIECEEMINIHPEVCTLRFPRDEWLIPSFIECLWVLDKTQSSHESSSRTEMYKNEFIRQTALAEMQANITEEQKEQRESLELRTILRQWQMKLVVWKTTVSQVKSNAELSERGSELLQRTNQFKLNNLMTSFEAMENDDDCLLVSLEDAYGVYGVISFSVLKHEIGSIMLKQWLISCRALGRGVEHRIFREILESYGDFTDITVDICETGQNIPMLQFMESVDITPKTKSTTSLEVLRKLSSNIFDNSLHTVVYTNDYTLLALPRHNHIKHVEQSKELVSGDISSLGNWILTQWSDVHLQHALKNNTLPMPYLDKEYSDLLQEIPKLESMTTPVSVIQQMWKNILQTEEVPKDDDNFFEEGGNSFKAVFLVSEIHRVLGLDLSILDISSTPSFSSLKRRIEKHYVDRTGSSKLPDIKKKERSGKEITLSEAQKRMLVLQNAVPESTAYTETIALRTETNVDTELILKEMVRRHPLMLASYDLAKKTLSISHENISTVIQSLNVTVNSMSDLREYIHQNIPAFNLSGGVLSQMKVITSGKTKIVVIHVHHIIIDDVTIQNIKTTFKMLLQNPPLDVQVDRQDLFLHSSVIDSEKEYMMLEKFTADKLFWEMEFEECPESSSLSFRNISDISDFEAYTADTTVSFLPVSSGQEIESFCKLHGLTKFQVFLALFVLVLQRYLGSREVVVAIPVSTRDVHTLTADGLFVNTVLFRYTINMNDTLEEHVLNVTRKWLTVFIHSRYPLNKVSEMIWRKNGKNLGCFCSVMFSYITFNASKDELRIHAKHAKMQLSVGIAEDTDGYEILCERSEKLIDKGLSRRIAGCMIEVCNKFQILLGRKSLCFAEFLTEEEIKLQDDFTETEKIDYTSESVYAMFVRNTKTKPAKTALVYRGKNLTYSSIMNLSDNIAFQILKCVDSNALKSLPIILIMEKNEIAIAAMFAVWKLGGFFLPVSVLHASTVTEAIERANPCLILINDDRFEIYAQNSKCKIVCLKNSLDHSVPEMKTYDFPIVQELEKPAYMIQTSGSTGKPKQIRISHMSISILARAWTKRYALQKYDVNILQWAPLSFDVFIGDIVRGMCCTSGTVCICPDNSRLDMDYITKMIRTEHITLVEFTPQFALTLVENSNTEDLKSLKILILGSDVLPTEVYRKIQACLQSNQRLINSYGMSEATIDSSCFEAEYMPITRGGTVPIGKPLPGVRMKVLEPETLRPCPVGTLGELYIGGHVVGSGDTDIVTLSSGEAMLKTNDRACWLPSGDLELFGRLDSVCKLRGFRICTAEIENTILIKCGFVREVTVTALTSEKDGTRMQFLCAFVVLENLKELSDVCKDKIIQSVKEQHPYYMVPDLITAVENIPLTANGKVNHAALPSVLELLHISKTDEKLEISGTAYILRQMFAETLGIDSSRVDTRHTFFDQGGHSLLLMQFHSLIKRNTDYDVTIADIFSYPSLESLADFVDKLCSTHENLKTKTEAAKTNERQFAITGVGFRLPGNIRTLCDFWKVFEEEINVVGSFPENRKQDVLNCFPNSMSLKKSDVYQGAFLADIDQFDNKLFQISSAEAKNMSPEQRLFFEVASETLCLSTDISKVNGKDIGVFLSNTEVSYAQLHKSDEATEISGHMPGMIATRIAYHYNLKGPTMLVDTACSSALTSLKIACESMENGDCSAALVGGMNIVLYPSKTGIYGDKGIMSKDFVCRPFDELGNGTVVGEGIICFYVEPLRSAIECHKHIYAVLKSIAVNSVGKGNGITAPSSSSQVKVIRKSLSLANISPSEVSFLECHGTGTMLGDRIELSALCEVFPPESRSDKLAIGSIKSAFGHLDSAAGFAGLLKIIASFMFQNIPPTLNFKRPHSVLKKSQLYVPNKIVKWEVKDNQRRIAGLSSFGLTGTNCHAILSDYFPFSSPCSTEKYKAAGCLPLLLSGASYEHVKKQACLHESLVTQTVQRRSINTLDAVCVSIACKLKQLQDKDMVYNNIRMVVMVTDAVQLLSALRLIIEAEENQFSTDRINLQNADIYINADDSTISVNGNKGIERFLRHGLIDVDMLFPNLNKLEEVFAPGLSIAICNTKRFWQNSVSAYDEESGVVDLLNRRMSEAREMVRTLPLAPPIALQELEGKFCSMIVLKLLESTPLLEYIESEHDVSFECAFKITEILTKYEKFFFVMLRELMQNEYIVQHGIDSSRFYLDRFSFKGCNKHRETPESIAAVAVAKYPSWADCFRFPLYCSEFLKDVLLGKMSPLSVIYPQGDLNFMYKFDKLGDLLGDVYYNMYMQLIVEYTSTLSKQGQKVRILEVGAGMGYVTRQLLPRLSNIPDTEYWFTDLGKAFVDNAKTVFSKYKSMMKFSTFDITKRASEQGVLGSFDIVISYNVIHTTQSVMESLLSLKSCLGRDGTLFIIESAKNETWATLAWGVLDGWWYFKDYDLRPYEPMLEPEKWEAVLQRMNFGAIHSCPTDEEERKHVEKFLFVCSANATTSEKFHEPLCEWWQNIDSTVTRYKDFQEKQTDDDRTSSGIEEHGARNSIKQELKNIWCELLDLDDINEYDDFNALGGESLLAIQMMTMVRKRIGFQLEIADTFSYTSLGLLGNYIAEQFEADSSMNNECDTSDVQKITNPSGGLPLQMNTETCIKSGSMLMFPGQGAQKVGMCKTITDCKTSRQVFEKAEKYLGYNILDICLGSEDILKEKLSSTEFVQTALFVSCMAKVEDLQENGVTLQTVSCVAGLSVGELAALVYAEVLSFNDALKIVQYRGKCMDAELSKQSTAMASILGPDTLQLQTFLNNAFPHVQISTFLADKQHTVAGTVEDIEALINFLDSDTGTRDRLSVIDVRRMRVAGAFHSSYMKTVAANVSQTINSCVFNKPSIPIVMNATGSVCDNPEQIKVLLSKQIESAVRWKKSMETAYGMGVRHFIEVAPSRVLSTIVKTRIERCKGCKSELIPV